MIYGSEQTDRTRFASFVATTNNRHPLQDHTGSRRFICIELTRGKLIDNTLDIDYEQLYAQVLHELHAGERYWFTQEEVLAIQRANMPYHATFDLEVMVHLLPLASTRRVRAPSDTDRAHQPDRQAVSPDTSDALDQDSAGLRPPCPRVPA